MPALTSWPVGVARSAASAVTVERVEGGVESGVCANAWDVISAMTLVMKKVFIELQRKQSAGVIEVGCNCRSSGAEPHSGRGPRNSVKSAVYVSKELKLCGPDFPGPTQCGARAQRFSTCARTSEFARPRSSAIAAHRHRALSRAAAG